MAKRKLERVKNNKTEMAEFSSSVGTKRERAQVLNFDKLRELMLQNVSKSSNKTYTQYTKELIKQYIQSPYANIDNIREVSRFLSRVSMIYKKILEYYATMPLFYYNVTYISDFTKETDKSKMLKSYQSLLKRLQQINMKKEFSSVISTAIRDGACFGFIYDYEEDGMFISYLDPKYCKINGKTSEGQWVISFDATYFDTGNNKEFIYGINNDGDGVWDDAFIQGYTDYKSLGRDYRWFTLPPEKTLCIIAGNEDEFDVPLPYFTPLFISLLDLIDLEQIIMSKTELENYVLLVSKIPLINGSNDVDDFAVSLDLVQAMQEMIDSAVPDLIGTAYAPFDIDKITFEKSNSSEDTDALAQSMTNLFSNGGMSQLVVSGGASRNSVGLKHAIQNDESLAFKFLDRLESWMKTYIKWNITEDFIFKFHRVSYFSSKEYSDMMKEAATLGGSAMDYLTSLGKTPYEAYNSLMMEKSLDIKSMMIPLSTSYTQTNNTTGAPTVSDDELSDEGLKTRDGEKNNGTSLSK